MGKRNNFDKQVVMVNSKNSKNNKGSVTVKELEKSEVELSIKIPAKELDKYIEKTINKLGSELKIDGFRQGKIPADVVERTAGPDRVFHEAAEEAVKDAYVNAILDQKIEAIGEPQVALTKMAKGNDLEFTATVGVLPKIKLEGWEADVKKINEKFRNKKIEVDEKQIDREVEFLAKQRAKIVTVNRQAKKDDQVELDFDVTQDNVPLENGSAKKQRIIIGEGKFIPGFEEHLIGMKAGEEKTFTLKFPKQYHAKHLADKDAKFDVKVHTVQERQIPEINDEFASGIGKFKDLKNLRENIHEGIEHEAKHKNEDQQKKEIIESISEKMKLDIPSVLVDREIEVMLSELEADIQKIGLNKAQYFQQLKTSEEKLKEEWKNKQAQTRVKAALAIREISKKEGIVPSSEEIEQEANKIMEYYQSIGQTEDKMDIKRLYEATKGNLTNEKVFEFLMKK